MTNPRPLAESQASHSSAQRLCPKCDHDIPVRSAFCPHCGCWDRAGRYARVLDPLAGIMMFAIAALVTVPTGSLLLDAVRAGGNQTLRILFAAQWHLWVWGVPALSVIVHWRSNVLNGRLASEGLWRTYYRAQLIALVLPLIIFAVVAFLFSNL